MLSDDEILAKLRDLEDSFIERKTEGDSSDWLKTVVAFANTAPVGYPSILFIGVRDDGSIQGLENPDSTQRAFARKVSAAYPEPYYWTRTLQSTGGHFIAVVVPGSPARPHFAGKAFVRSGSQTVDASDEQFERIVAERSNQAYEVRKWIGKSVSVWHPNRTGGTYHPTLGYKSHGVIADCNSFFFTLQNTPLAVAPNGKVSFNINAVDLGWDHEANRLELRFKDSFN
jgi:hypothetical protein